MLETLILGLLILVLRCADVSLGTLKTIFVVEGRSALAPSLGFVEATVYVIAASVVFSDLGNPVKILGFGLGYGIGTALGMYLAHRLGLGSITLRFFASGDADDLIDALRAEGFRLTTIFGSGRDGPVAMIQMNIRKRLVRNVLETAQPWLDRCFVTVGDEPLVTNDAPAILEAIRNMRQMPWAVFGRRPHA
jgi:uncharacterized protein YebE (UPF0316 family)